MSFVLARQRLPASVHVLASGGYSATIAEPLHEGDSEEDLAVRRCATSRNSFGRQAHLILFY